MEVLHHNKHQKIEDDLLRKDQSVKKHETSSHSDKRSASASANEATTTSPPTPASPPSSTTSPSHEFSFTISLQSSVNTNPLDNSNSKFSKTPPNSFAIDLSPADDIFFHGHLLPLHLLAHLPVSPRSSTNSLDSFTLPVKDFFDDQTKPYNTNNNNTSSINQETNNKEGEYSKSRNKYSKTFSLFKWRKSFEVKESEEKEKHNNNNNNNKKKMKFDVSHVLKRYVRMVRPLLFFKGRKENVHFNGRQAYSFSGNVSMRNRRDQLRGRRGEFSAPASMRTSPTNSGLLVATSTNNNTTIPSPTSDSTMEELQAAIQAAIAHCKNSCAVEDKLVKC
ncbi:hypothetical protein ACFE04_004764 [Oxalis oulophora]